jgi:hypothetical protein
VYNAALLVAILEHSQTKLVACEIIPDQRDSSYSLITNTYPAGGRKSTDKVSIY